ncbi:hypothetical protein Dsin_003024 [Dipteronia sinensis]|uniref:Uncharacterized protein n=1 Tax=Dipteronia sinensis TaxID=43782 RepID=A0AAE0EJU4_9ROSI|nr:hypothetical protein Dsin_003024 [Dipteronia sinensis]
MSSTEDPYPVNRYFNNCILREPVSLFQAASMSITSVLYLKDEVSIATAGAVNSCEVENEFMYLGLNSVVFLYIVFVIIVQGQTKGASDDTISSHICTSQSQQGSITAQVNDKHEHSKCQLLHWYGDNAEEVVVEGSVASTDLNTKVHYIPRLDEIFGE